MSNHQFTPPEHWQARVWPGGNDLQALTEQTVSATPLQPDDVLVKNAAIGLNPVDWKVLGNRAGWVPGVDGAGTVVAAGSEVDPQLIGCRVAYHQNLQRDGSYAEYTAIRAQTVMRIPDGLDFVTATAFPCPGLTAWQAIEKIPVTPGAAVLIAGAGGSVGNFLVQLASARGFEVTVLSSERHWSRLHALGAKYCLDDERYQASQPRRRYFAVIDAVNQDHAALLSADLLANGHLVCIQGRVAQWPNPAFGRALSLHEVALGALHQHGDESQWRALTQQGERMLQQINAGTLESELLLTFPREQLAEQLLRLKHRDFSGKQIIVL